MSGDHTIGIHPSRSIVPAALPARRIYHVGWIPQTFGEHTRLSTVTT
jgi:hypothetical protein